MHPINEEDDLANISEALLDKSSIDFPNPHELHTPNPLLCSQNSAEIQMRGTTPE